MKIYNIKNWLLLNLPNCVIENYKSFNFRKKNIIKRDKKYEKLSNEEIFSQIYKNKLWGDDNSQDFYSGPGSHDVLLSKKYKNAILNYFNGDIKNMSFLDLGCGDFKIGELIYKNTKKYIGIDVVPELIERNKKLYRDENLFFSSYDIINKKLPYANCVLIREVLQHLTNREVKIILKKLIIYKHIIVTESIPIGNFIPNLDKVKGPESREYVNSGVVIHETPFNFKFKEKFELLRIKRPGKDFLVTTVYVQ